MPIHDSNVSDAHNLYADILAQIFDETAPDGRDANTLYTDEPDFAVLEVTGAKGAQTHTFVKFKADRNSRDVGAAVDEAIHFLGKHGIVASKQEGVSTKKLPRLVIDLDQDDFVEKLTALQEACKDDVLKPWRRNVPVIDPFYALDYLRDMPRKPDGTALDPEMAATLVPVAYQHLKETVDGLGKTAQEALKKAIGEGRQRSML